MISYLYGINTIQEALQAGHAFKKVYILQSKEKNERIEQIISLCKENGVQFRFENNDFFLREGREENHQGVLAELKSSTRFLADPDSVFAEEKAVILVLDGITDQQNMGAISRSAWFFGVSLIVIEDHGSAPVNEVVHKISSGASLLIPFYVTPSLLRTIENGKEKGFSVFSTSNSEASKSLYEASFPDKTILIIGSEGKGVRPHLTRLCTESLRIDGNSGFDSLNAASACAVVLYEMNRQKKG